MPSTNLAKEVVKAILHLMRSHLDYGQESFRKLHLYALRLYNFVRGFKRAYNWTKKSVSKSYNQGQNEFRYFALKGVFELFFSHEARIVTYIIQATVSLTLKILLRSTLQQKVLHKLCSFPFVQTSAHCWSATKTETM